MQTTSWQYHMLKYSKVCKFAFLCCLSLLIKNQLKDCWKFLDFCQRIKNIPTFSHALHIYRTELVVAFLTVNGGRERMKNIAKRFKFYSPTFTLGRMTSFPFSIYIFNHWHRCWYNVVFILVFIKNKENILSKKEIMNTTTNNVT